MIMFLLTTIVEIIGLIAFYNDVYWLIIICGVLIFLENLRGYLTGQLKSFFFIILALVIGYRLADGNNVWAYMSVALCYESAIMGVLSIPILVIGIKASIKKAHEESVKSEIDKYFGIL